MSYMLAAECNTLLQLVCFAKIGLCCAGQSDMLECQCCFCEVDVGKTTAMDCGHAFCNDCWRQHCITQIGDGRSRKLLCMGIKCNAVCDEDKVGHTHDTSGQLIRDSTGCV